LISKILFYRRGKKLMKLKRKLVKLLKQNSDNKKCRNRKKWDWIWKNKKKKCYKKKTKISNNKWNMVSRQSRRKLILRRKKRPICWNSKDKKLMNKYYHSSSKTNSRMLQSSRWSRIKSKNFKKERSMRSRKESNELDRN
jgi:hypothetical protein